MTKRTTTRPFMMSVDMVMKLYDENMSANKRFLLTVLESLSPNKMGIKVASVFVFRYYGVFLRDHGLYERALAEFWGMRQVAELMIQYKKHGKITLT